MSHYKINPKRNIVFCISILIIGGVFISRLAYIQLIQHQHYTQKANRQLKHIINIHPNRGDIYTKDHTLLATMKTSYSIFALPKTIKSPTKNALALSPILNIPVEELAKKMSKNTHFVWIKRHTNTRNKEKIKELNLQGIKIIQEKQRHYPQQKLASHIIGFTGIDNQGLSGIEYSENNNLKGNPGKIILEKDPRGRSLITGKKIHYKANHGSHLILTIDTYTQHITEQYLKEGIKKYQATKGYAIVLEPNTGHILALASYPNFNPNNWQHASNQIFKNPCITDVFEPGSVIKGITIAMALEEGRIQATDKLYVPRNLKVYKHTINEAHPPKEDDPYLKSITDILKYSSNIGTALIAQKSNKYELYRYLRKFGFGKRSNCNLPGESKGILHHPNNWSGIDLETHAFGQGLAVTPLQLAAAMNVFANNGSYIQPKLIYQRTNNNFDSFQKNTLSYQQQVLSPKTNALIKEMLSQVVEGGTAWPVKIPHYKVAGKTGTAQKAKEDGLGYQEGNYMASFVGFLPFNKPRAVIAVILDSPQTSIYGGHTSGVIFKNIAESLINHFHYPPDTP
ncbi:MAG: penicillin-binding protein 2 [bacterium]